MTTYAGLLDWIGRGMPPLTKQEALKLLCSTLLKAMRVKFLRGEGLA